MIRFQALSQYTQDHMVMLAHARALEAAAAKPAHALAPAKGFHQYWENVLTAYIREAQDVLIPRVAEVSLQGRFSKLTTEMRDACDQMRVFLLDGALVAPFLPRVAKALHAYVQYAEGHMLTDLQNNLDDAGLAAIAQASLAYRKRHRPGAVGEPKTEKTFLPASTGAPAAPAAGPPPAAAPRATMPAGATAPRPPMPPPSAARAPSGPSFQVRAPGAAPPTAPARPGAAAPTAPTRPTPAAPARAPPAPARATLPRAPPGSQAPGRAPAPPARPPAKKP